MKKGDFVIIGLVCILVVASVFSVVSFLKPGERVVIKQDDKIVYDKSINVNATFDTGTNVVIIQDGIVYMKDATCKNQICVNTGKISKKGEMIVCLPNKVTVKIK